MSTDFNNVRATGLTEQGLYAPDLLYERETITRAITIAFGAGALPRGALLGKITSSGKYLLSLSASEDGSQVPSAVLLEAVDATTADAGAIVAIRGRFNSGAVTFGTGHSASEADAVLRDRSIYLETVIG